MQFGFMAREQLMVFSSCDKFKRKTPSREEEAVLGFCVFGEDI